MHIEQDVHRNRGFFFISLTISQCGGHGPPYNFGIGRAMRAAPTAVWWPQPALFCRPVLGGDSLTQVGLDEPAAYLQQPFDELGFSLFVGIGIRGAIDHHAE